MEIGFELVAVFRLEQEHIRFRAYLSAASVRREAAAAAVRIELGQTGRGSGGLVVVTFWVGIDLTIDETMFPSRFSDRK